ncbi:hypothetical protein Trydic_g11770 [Trypoxylus dichotomus]
MYLFPDSVSGKGPTISNAIFSNGLEDVVVITIDSQLLYDAAKTGHLKIVDYLIREKEVEVNTSSGDRTSPLFTASIHGHEDLIKSLIEYGANVNKFENDFTLHFSLAANRKTGCYNIAKLLLEKRADVNAKASKGFTALHIAAIHGHLDINAQTEDGSTPRNFVEEMHHPHILAYLKEEKNI